MPEFEHADVAALHREDQTFPKRCGHYDDKSLVPAVEMAQKLRASRDAAGDPDLVLIAGRERAHRRRPRCGDRAGAGLRGGGRRRDLH